MPTVKHFSSIQEILVSKLVKAHQAGQKASIDVARPVDDELAAVPNEYQPFNAMDLYQRLVMADLDIKGNMASCYANFGAGFQINLEFNFADLICPGLANLTIGATSLMSKMSSALLVIHRNMPSAFLLNIAIADKKKKELEIPYPVCYQTLTGDKTKIKLTIGGHFKLGKKLIDLKEKPESPVAAALQFEAKASASVEAVAMHVVDYSPGLYPKWTDENLKTDFENSMGSISHEDIVEILTTNFYDYSIAWSVMRLSHQNDPVFKDIKTTFDELANKRQLNTKIKESTWEGLKTEIWKAAANKGSILKKIWNKVGSKLTSQDFESLKNQFIKWNTLLQEHAVQHDAEISEIIKTLDWDIKQLNSDGKIPSENPDHFFSKIGDRLDYGEYSNRQLLEKMNFLDYTSLIPNAEATISGDLSIKAKVGAVNANAKFGANIKAQMGFSLYRYQNYSEYSLKNYAIKGNIIFTQDVALTYRQLTGLAQAGIKALSKLGKDIKKDYLYNQITYRAVQAYWLLPFETQMRPPSGKYDLLSGSGISYGFSIRPEALSSFCTTLFKKKSLYIKLPKKGTYDPDEIYPVLKRRYKRLSTDFINEETDKAAVQLLQSIAAALHVRPAEVVEFLDGAQFPEIDTTQLNKVNAVILESNYRITKSGIKIAITETKGVPKVEDLLDNIEAPIVKTLPPVSPRSKHAKLSSIRIRFRVADYEATEETKFKLGIPKVDQLSIELKKVSEAGLEGIIDLYTYWFPPFRDLFGDHNVALEAQMVPPVALFFQ